jgi:hypothetical protein
MACVIAQAVRHCLNAHVRYVAGEEALEQVSPQISSVSPANQHSTFAPYLSQQICDIPNHADRFLGSRLYPQHSIWLVTKKSQFYGDTHEPGRLWPI